MALTNPLEMPVNTDRASNHVREVSVSEESRRNARLSADSHLALWEHERNRLSVRKSQIELELAAYNNHAFQTEQYRIMSQKNISPAQTRAEWARTRDLMSRTKTKLMDELREVCRDLARYKSKVADARGNVHQHEKTEKGKWHQSQVALWTEIRDTLKEILEILRHSARQ